MPIMDMEHLIKSRQTSITRVELIRKGFAV